MKIVYILILIFSVVFFVVIIMGGIFVSKENMGLRPPVAIPFSITNAGGVLRVKIDVVERGWVTFGLAFLVNKKIKNDSELLMNLLEEQTEGSDKGNSICISLRIESLKKTPYFSYSKIESEMNEYAWSSDERYKKIDDVLLEPGIYMVRVVNLKSVPGFSGRTVNFLIHQTYKGK